MLQTTLGYRYAADKSLPRVVLETPICSRNYHISLFEYFDRCSYVSLWAVCHSSSITSGQDAVTNLCRCIVEIKIKAMFKMGVVQAMELGVGKPLEVIGYTIIIVRLPVSEINPRIPLHLFTVQRWWKKCSDLRWMIGWMDDLNFRLLL